MATPFAKICPVELAAWAFATQPALPAERASAKIQAMFQPSKAPAAPSTPLARALDRSRSVQDSVEQSADELLLINTVLKHEIPDEVQVDVPTLGPVTVPFASVESAKLVLTNTLIAAAKPLDMTDAEDFIETPDAANDTDTTED